MHGIEVQAPEEVLRELDGRIAEKLAQIRAMIAARERVERINTISWELRDLLERWNGAMQRYKLEGNSEKEYFARRNAAAGKGDEDALA